MRKALYFDTPDDFCDFVRLQGVDARPGTGTLFEIHRVVHSSRPADSALVLFNFSSNLKEDFSGPALAIKAEIANGAILREDHAPASPVIETIHANTLIECVELAKWKAGRAAGAGSGPVFFRVEDGDLVASLINDSLRLGNDRIQFGPIRNRSGEEVTIVRIEKPSFYLVQRCLEDYAGKITVFYRETDDLFVRWGWEHPLRDWWKLSERKREGQWVFLEEGADFFHVEPVIWRDAYELTDLQLDFSHREVYSESPDSPPRFEVLLRLTKKAAETGEPELWLLDDAGIRQLESTLQMTDDESLRSWQISVQTMPENPGEWIFIRETRSKSRYSRHHDFGGTGFVRYRGINDLLLPVGYELQPPLRRDAYRHLFSLEAGFLTVLIPESLVVAQAGEEEFLIVKINERSFDSLNTFVDYIVERDAAVLEDLLGKSVFDFKHYLKAPSHPGLTSGEKNDDGNEKKSVPNLEIVSRRPLADLGRQEKFRSGIHRDGDMVFEELDESAAGELEKEELRLERELTSHGQRIDLWCDLLLCKNQLGKSADAILCAIEALWMAWGTPAEDDLIKSLHALSLSSVANDPLSVTTMDLEWVRRAAVFGVVLSEPEPRAVDQWISEATAFLREHDNGLRAKERWLAWGRVLMKNRDDRRETQLREEIRNQITGQGLPSEETPVFLRSRIFQDRKMGSDDESRATIETAIRNLESLQSAASNFTTARLSLTSRAILARAYSKVGDIARARNLLSEPSQSDDSCALAWEAMFQIEALRTIDLTRANATNQKMDRFLKSADPHTGSAIQELRELYQERGDADNPAAFLAGENWRRTYPHGPGSEVGVLYDLSMQLEECIASGDESGAVLVMRVMMTLEKKSDYDHHVKLPQFVETIVAGLERFKWGDRGAALIPLYEEFSDRAPGYVSGGGGRFYASILHSNLAHGLLVVENLNKAIHQIQLADRLVRSQDLPELDFIDSASALIKAVEQLPLSNRRSTLTALLITVGERFDQSDSQYLGCERIFAALAKLIDQIVEAASSKDRLSLQQFRTYQLQDEFLILQRIQSETFTGKNP